MDVLGDQGYYDVSNFALNTMETSELCPTGNCEYDLEGGQLNPDYAGNRTFSGKLRIDDGESTKIMNLLASWHTIEEREDENGELTKYIEGTLGIGREEFNPDFEYRTNGTMTPDGENLALALHGER
jgi:hypothetical protein